METLSDAILFYMMHSDHMKDYELHMSMVSIYKMIYGRHPVNGNTVDIETLFHLRKTIDWAKRTSSTYADKSEKMSYLAERIAGSYLGR